MAGMVVSFQVLTDRIAAELRIPTLPHYSRSMDGLQLRNEAGEVLRLIAAVDASLPVLRKAAAKPSPGAKWAVKAPAHPSRLT